MRRGVCLDIDNVDRLLRNHGELFDVHSGELVCWRCCTTNALHMCRGVFLPGGGHKWLRCCVPERVILQFRDRPRDTLPGGNVWAEQRPVAGGVLRSVRTGILLPRWLDQLIDAVPRGALREPFREQQQRVPGSVRAWLLLSRRLVERVPSAVPRRPLGRARCDKHHLQWRLRRRDILSCGFVRAATVPKWDIQRRGHRRAGVHALRAQHVRGGHRCDERRALRVVCRGEPGAGRGCCGAGCMHTVSIRQCEHDSWLLMHGMHPRQLQ